MVVSVFMVEFQVDFLIIPKWFLVLISLRCSDVQDNRQTMLGAQVHQTALYMLLFEKKIAQLVTFVIC